MAKIDNLQEKIFELIDFDDLAESIKEIVDPNQRVNAYMGLLPYVLPKLQSVQQDITTRQKDAMGQLLESLSKIPQE